MSKKYSRLFWILAALCLLVSLLGCAPQETAKIVPTNTVVEKPAPTDTPVPMPVLTDTQEAPTAEPTQGPVLVKIITGTSFPTFMENVQEALKSLQKSFNETHTNIQIEIQLPESGTITDLTQVIKWPQPPDIALGVGVGGVASIRGEWLDLTPFIEADDYDLSRFTGPAMKIHSNNEGEIIVLPFIDYPSVMFFNPKLFDQAQVAYPPKEFGAPYTDGEPWTYDKLVEIAQTLTAKTGQFGYTHEPNEYAMDYASKFGHEPSLGVSSDFKFAAFNTQMFNDAMQWDMDTVWKWSISPSLDQINATNNDPFGSERVAMFEEFSWYSIILFDGNNTNWDIAAIPQGPNGKIVSVTDVDGIGILKVSLHPQEAWEVLKWLYEPEQLKVLTYAWLEEIMGVPEDVQLQEELSSILAKNFDQVDIQVLVDASNYADVVNHESWRPDNNAVREVMEMAHREIMSKPNADIDLVLEKANADVQALLDAYWKANP